MPVTQTPLLAGDAAAAEALEAAILFPEGLVGCESWKRFVLLSADDADLPIGMLQSLDREDVALMVTTPSMLLPDYRAQLDPEDRVFLGLDDGAEPVLYCTLTLGKDGWLTANLLGPLAINPTLRRGRQIVLSETAYSTRHPVAQLSAAEAGACSS